MKTDLLASPCCMTTLRDACAARSRIANAAYEVGMGLFHRTVEQWFGKPAYAQFVLAAFEKPSDGVKG